MGRERPCRRAFGWYLEQAHPRFAARADAPVRSRGQRDRLRDDDELARAASRPGAPRPRARRRGRALDLDAQLARGGVAGHAAVGGGLALLGGAGSSCSRGCRAAWRGSRAEVSVASAPADWPICTSRPNGCRPRAPRRARRAPERVEHEVEAVAAARPRAARRRGRRARLELHGGVGAELGGALEPSSLRAAATTRPAPSSFAAWTRDLRRRRRSRRARAPSRPLAGAAPLERAARPRARRRRGRRRAPDRARRAPGSRSPASISVALGERAERLAAALEVDEAAVRAPADALLARDVGRLVALGGNVPGRDPHVDRVHAGGERRRATSAPSPASGSSNSPTSGIGAIRAQDGGSHRRGYYDPPSDGRRGDRLRRARPRALRDPGLAHAARCSRSPT